MAKQKQINLFNQIKENHGRNQLQSSSYVPILEFYLCQNQGSKSRTTSEETTARFSISHYPRIIHYRCHRMHAPMLLSCLCSSTQQKSCKKGTYKGQISDNILTLFIHIENTFICMPFSMKNLTPCNRSPESRVGTTKDIQYRYQSNKSHKDNNKTTQISEKGNRIKTDDERLREIQQQVGK